MSLKDDLVAMLQEELKGMLTEGKDHLGDLKGYVEEITPQIVKWATEDPEDARRNLAHLKAQAVLIAGIKAIEVKKSVIEHAVVLVAKAVRIALMAA